MFPQGVQAPVILHVSYRESSSTIVCRTITCKLPCAFISFVIECKFVPEHFEQGAFQSRPISQIYTKCIRKTTCLVKKILFTCTLLDALAEALYFAGRFS